MHIDQLGTESFLVVELRPLAMIANLRLLAAMPHYYETMSLKRQREAELSSKQNGHRTLVTLSPRLQFLRLWFL